jgi:hypothetical protein
MIKLVNLLKEVQLSSNEQAVIDDILSLDEAIDFSSVMDKVKNYVKKGLITATILASLLNNSAFSQEQKDQIKDVVKTEKQVDNDVISFEDFKELIKDEGFDEYGSTMLMNMIKNVKQVKIYRRDGNTIDPALSMIQQQIRLDKLPQSIRRFEYTKKVKNGYEILVAVPIPVPVKEAEFGFGEFPKPKKDIYLQLMDRARKDGLLSDLHYGDKRIRNIAINIANEFEKMEEPNRRSNAELFVSMFYDRIPRWAWGNPTPSILTKYGLKKG